MGTVIICLLVLIIICLLVLSSICFDCDRIGAFIVCCVCVTVTGILTAFTANIKIHESNTYSMYEEMESKVDVFLILETAYNRNELDTNVIKIYFEYEDELITYADNLYELHYTTNWYKDFCYKKSLREEYPMGAFADFCTKDIPNLQ